MLEQLQLQRTEASTVARTIRTVKGAPLLGVDHSDDLAVEQPLQILVDGVAFRSTARTPGDDELLVTGLLAAEAIINAPDELAELIWSGPNQVDVRLTADAQRRRQQRPAQAAPGSVAQVTTTIEVTQLLRLPTELRARQEVFSRTGASHAVGLFLPDTEPLAVFEDIGRHNAFDKVLGWAMHNRGWPISDCVIFVSGRQSLDLVSKAVAAGVAILAGVSAPSSLAVDTARETGLTLCGFVRPGYVNVYSHPHRVAGIEMTGQ